MDGKEIEGKIRQYLESQIRRYPRTSNIPSSLGFPCLRERVYEFTNWEDKILGDVQRQATMMDGNLHERGVKSVLEAAGLEVTSQNRPFKWAKYNISGKIVGMLLEKETRKEFPIEIKATTRWYFDDYHDSDDFKFAEDHWVVGYYAQLQMYLMMSEKDKGFFIIKNKDNGLIKVIDVLIDYEFIEKVLKDVEKINLILRDIDDARSKNALTPEKLDELLPPKINSADLCPRCPFVHVCLPDYQAAGIVFLEDDILLQKLRRYIELKTARSEYESLDKVLKEQLKERNISVGEFLVTGKWVDQKEKPAQAATRYWKKKIEQIDKTGAAVMPTEEVK